MDSAFAIAGFLAPAITAWMLTLRGSFADGFPLMTGLSLSPCWSCFWSTIPTGIGKAGQAVLRCNDCAGPSVRSFRKRPVTKPYPAPTSGEDPSVAQPRLLIVEDELMVAWGLLDTARELGWKVCATVRTQDAAVEAASQLRPDAILMDYRLAAGGDGLTAARRIREATDVPIIFCTAYVAGLRPDVLTLPRAQLLSKPVHQSSLREALAWAMGISKPGEGRPEHTR